MPQADKVGTHTMTKNSKQFMSAFALSAAALFLGGCKKTEPTVEPTADPATTADSDVTPDEQVKCFGINECAGQSVCAVNKPDLGIEHSCAGENECNGKGWIQVSHSDCDAKGGEVLGVL